MFSPQLLAIVLLSLGIAVFSAPYVSLIAVAESEVVDGCSLAADNHREIFPRDRPSPAFTSRHQEEIVTHEYFDDVYDHDRPQVIGVDRNGAVYSRDAADRGEGGEGYKVGKAIDGSAFETKRRICHVQDLDC